MYKSQTHSVMHRAKIILVSFILSLLVGCGFHLRGTAVMPSQLQQVVLQTSPSISAQLQHDLVSTLQRAGTRVISDPRHAKAILHIEDEHTQQTFNSVNSNIQLHNYQLQYHIRYQLLSVKERALQPPQTITVNRLFSDNANQVLGSSHERDVIINEMRKEALTKLITRLAANDTIKLLH